MKKWLSKIFGKLLAVGENRYVHSTIGALIASITLCVLLPFLAWWIAVVVAFVLAVILGFVKEFVLDSKADGVDILFTLFGALLPIIPLMIWTLLFI